MRVFAALTQRRWFRLLWWVICLPRELLYLVLLPVALALYLVTSEATLCLCVALWASVHFSLVTPPYELVGEIDDWFFIAVTIALWFCTRCAYVLRQLARFLLATDWRLSPRKASPKEVRARIVVKAKADRRESRRRMTERLSPELKGMIASARSLETSIQQRSVEHAREDPIPV